MVVIAPFPLAVVVDIAFLEGKRLVVASSVAAA